MWTVAEYSPQWIVKRLQETFVPAALGRGWHAAEVSFDAYERRFTFDAYAPERSHGPMRVEGHVAYPPPRLPKQAWRWTVDWRVAANAMDRLQPDGFIGEAVTCGILTGHFPEDYLERKAAEAIHRMVLPELPTIDGGRADAVEMAEGIRAEAARREREKEVSYGW
jgi:hypothetical protein